MHYFFKDLLPDSGAWFRQTMCIVIMTKEGSSKIVNFMTFRWGVLVLVRVHKMHFFKDLIPYSGTWFRQTMYIVMITKEGSAKIVNFMTSRWGVLKLRRGHISYIVKMHSLRILFSTTSYKLNKLRV